jgi:peptidoglycan hydrolase CwlO-like protein
MKKKILIAILAIALTTLSSFTTVTVNNSKDSDDTSGRSVFACIFLTAGVSFGDTVIIEPVYATWEDCRKAK